MIENYKGWFILLIIIFSIIAIYILYPYVFVHKFKIAPFGHKNYSCYMEESEQFFPMDEQNTILGDVDPIGTKYPVVKFPNNFDFKLNYFGNAWSDFNQRYWGIETSESLTYCENECITDASFRQCQVRDINEVNKLIYVSDEYADYKILIPLCTAQGTRIFKDAYDRDAIQYKIYPEYFIDGYFYRVSGEIETTYLDIYYLNSSGAADATYICSEKNKD